MFPSTQATEEASLFVKAQKKKTQSSARKIQFQYSADIQFFPKYVVAITITEQKKQNQTQQQQQKIVVIMYMPNI